MKILLFVLMFHSLCLSAETLSQSYNVDLMARHLRSIKTLKKLPARGGGYEFKRSSKVLPLTIKEKFSKIQSQVFSSPLISISFCEENNGPDSSRMQAMFEESHICVFEGGLTELLGELNEGQNSEIISYILAHEVSHFVTELSIPDSLGASRTLNGNISIYSYPFEIFVAEQLGVNFQDLNPEQLGGVSIFIPLYMELASKAHAEVDVFACLIMKQGGMDIPYDKIIQMFNGDKNPQTQDDTKERRGAISFCKNAFETSRF